MTLKDLYNYVLENNGATFCPLTKELFKPKDGFMVSHHDSEFVLDLDKLTPAIFIEIVDSHIVMQDEYVGIWINDNKVYFDISMYHTNLKATIIAGMNENQKAIWDFANDKAITLPTNQKSGTTTQQLEYQKQVAEKMIANYPECKWY